MTENPSSESCDVLVIGSGPAGLSAALAAAENGAKVILCERLRTFGLKLLASGGGKCNVSNRLEIPAFQEAFGREGRFMTPALNCAYHDWLFDFLKTNGVPLKLENGFHYFPVSERARDILDALINRILKLGGRMRSETRVKNLLTENGRISGIVTEHGATVACRSVILACGGSAWPKLGGTKSGLQLAESLGHTISPTYPAMAPLLIRDRWVGELAGISLPNAELSFRRGRLRFLGQGEILFTHEGFSGPCAIDLSGNLAETCAQNGGEAELIFRPDASRGIPEWKQELELLRKDDGRKLIRNLLSRFFPHSLTDTICSLAGCYDGKCCELPAVQRDSLCSLLAGIHLTASGAGPMEKAMAMKGGVKLKEIHPETLESRLVPGVFFAGEIMDLVGPCGGYNIQWALSSGRLAGYSATV